jgi:hypothetical protein
VVASLSLLDRAQQDILIFQAEDFEDELGNILIRPSAVGVPARAEIQAARQSGTSARRAEQDNEGYETEETYRLRFTREYDRTHEEMRPGAQVEWRGKRWSVVGYPTPYMASHRTGHKDYQIRRT